MSDGYRWGKPVGALGTAGSALKTVGATSTKGVFTGSDVAQFVTDFQEGLKVFKFVDRFAVDA